MVTVTVSGDTPQEVAVVVRSLSSIGEPTTTELCDAMLDAASRQIKLAPRFGSKDTRGTSEAEK